MRTWQIALAAACIAAAAQAQGVRVSSLHPNSSMTFHRYFKPFPRANTATACRHLCIRDSRCPGWTWYADPAVGERLHRVCILGAGLKDGQIGSRPGRFARIVTVR